VCPRFEAAGWTVHATDLPQLDITDEAAVHEAVAATSPRAVVNLAAVADADRSEREPVHARRVNAEGPRHLAEACAAQGALLCQISSDYVFDGLADRPYREDDPTRPLNAYGETKVAAEAVTLEVDGLVVRTAWLSGRSGANITKTALRLASDSTHDLAFVDDQRGSPTVAEDLAVALVELVERDVRGRFHVTNAGDASWYELVAHVLRCSGLGADRVRPITTAELVPPSAARRPAYSVLDGARLEQSTGVGPLRPWQDAVEELVADLVERTPAGTVRS